MVREEEGREGELVGCVCVWLLSSVWLLLRMLGIIELTLFASQFISWDNQICSLISIFLHCPSVRLGSVSPLSHVCVFLSANVMLWSVEVYFLLLLSVKDTCGCGCISVVKNVVCSVGDVLKRRLGIRCVSHNF